MALNKATGQMYTWITHTWNTVKGECPHGCTYCYMKRFGQQKPVRFDESELKTDLGSGNFIFVGSSCDLFADDILKEWITDTLVKTDFYTGNKYLFQSKNPNMFHYFMNYFPDGGRTSLCTTIETNRWFPKIMKQSPDPSHRAMWFGSIDLPKYVTIEPILDFDLEEMIKLIKQCNPIQVNIGADSGNNNLPEPSKEKLLTLIDELKTFTVIDQKRNLSRLLK